MLNLDVTSLVSIVCYLGNPITSSSACRLVLLAKFLKKSRPVSGSGSGGIEQGGCGLD